MVEILATFLREQNRQSLYIGSCFLALRLRRDSSQHLLLTNILTKIRWCQRVVIDDVHIWRDLGGTAHAHLAHLAPGMWLTLCVFQSFPRHSTAPNLRQVSASSALGDRVLSHLNFQKVLSKALFWQSWGPYLKHCAAQPEMPELSHLSFESSGKVETAWMDLIITSRGEVRFLWSSWDSFVISQDITSSFSYTMISVRSHSVSFCVHAEHLYMTWSDPV